MADPHEIPGASTQAVHGRLEPGARSRELTTPIYQSSAFDLGETDDWGYTRLGNPTLEAVAARIAGLERMEDALLFASGMAAISTTLLALLPPGGRVVAAEELCGETRELLTRELPGLGFETTFVSVSDAAGWARELRQGADVLFVETISNPTLRVADLDLLARLAKESKTLTVADSTLATPVNLRPGSHGVDVVVHSASKYLNGHSDLIAGAVAGSGELVARIRARAELHGGCLDPHAAFLLDRGLRTLGLRMQRHNESGLEVARWLAGHAEVTCVVHPLAAGHPDERLARRLLSGGSGIVTFSVLGGDERAMRLLEELRLVRHAPTLGGVESLACRQSSETGTRGFLRLSVGIEDVEDVIDDLEQALALTALARVHAEPRLRLATGADRV